MNPKEKLEKYVRQLIKRIKSIKKRSLYCIVAGFVLAIIAFFANQKSIYTKPNEIERGAYGTQKTPYTIMIDAENLARDMEFNVSVSSRKYTKDEADEIFDRKIEELKTNMLGDNESYERVSTKLDFSSDLGDGIKANYTFTPKRIDEFYEKYTNRGRSKKRKNAKAVSTQSDVDAFRYYVDYQGIIDGRGNVRNENFRSDEFCTGYIEIQLSTEIKEKEGTYKSEKYLIPVRIINRVLSPIEAFKIAFKKEIINSDNDTVEKKTITLPKVVENFKIRYKEHRDLGFLLMPIFGVLVAILLEAREKEAEREKAKKRIRWLELDFAQIITKILLYVSSGMTIRNSMIRLAEQYQKAKQSVKNFEPRVAYEELVIARNKLVSGYNEVSTYEEMAKNINLRTYTRFLNIIIQSIKNGNRDLKNILNMEVQDALYERKQHAKKLGEEAATKLVLPLMMMLSVIMVVIMVPAFMGM